METSPAALERARRAWRRVETWLGQHAPTIVANLRPGATESALDAFELDLGRPLPAEYRAVYRIHDGEAGGWGSVVPFFVEFLPLADVWRNAGWMRTLTAEARAEASIGVEVKDPGVVRPVAFSDACVPFARDGFGNYYAIDLDPGPKGTLGQVVSLGNDDLVQPRECWAPDLIAWFEQLADRMESGEVDVERDTDTDGSPLEHLED